MGETQEEIEKNIETMLEDFNQSDADVINLYNQEYRMLKDTVSRISSIDDYVVNLKAYKKLNDKNKFRSIIAIIILGSCFGLYNFINDISSESIGQLIIVFSPLIYYVMLMYENLFTIQKILDAPRLKANLLIGTDRDKLELFQIVHKLENLDWEKDPDKEVKCATARFNLIRSLIRKRKVPYPEGTESSIF